MLEAEFKLLLTKSEAYNTDGLKDTGTHDAPLLRWITFEFGGDVRTLDEYRDNYDEHSDQGESRGARKFVDVAVEGEGV